ncbi:MAG TPA: extracellular solute-binding protein [Paracoccus sp. (in: a-proteobacteria)]|uniref:ABC transporter substrate-binding protein n=1 Tax=Paracoccus sp. TaxID=267 RepID=UPI002B853B75|nr:extracellular solute-binding protein [Paracoccus sp. (in: a-proteobacteria)]HWL57715.1 extracellular solute-binding protein [Paracoccus sp. (in: a-proteobacteria)]
MAEALKVIGTSATLTEALRRRAHADLDFPVEFEVLDGLSCQSRGVLSPESYDVYDQWFHSVDLLWTAGSIQPIDTGRITHWDHVRASDVFAGAGKGFGTRPADVLYVQADRSLAATPASATPLISMLPTSYNVDSFAYTPELAARQQRDEVESWAWLLDGRWHGRCALSLDPAASAVELAMAIQAAGLMRIGDPGDLTVEEIDEMFGHLMARKRSGHFSRFWSSAEDSIRLLSTSGCVVSSLWSPAYYGMRRLGHDLTYAAPIEGYRGWHSGMCISAAVKGRRLEMAYRYLNWWLGGAPGAIMARQGYYISVPGPLSGTLTDQEWDYWYGGLPAATDLPDMTGTIVVQKGERRAGGDYRQRLSNVTVWSTIMPEHNYLVRRWHEFLQA